MYFLLYSFLTIQPSISRIPATRRSRGVARGVFSEEGSFDVLSSGFLIIISKSGSKVFIISSFIFWGEDSWVSILTVNEPTGFDPIGSFVMVLAVFS